MTEIWAKISRRLARLRQNVCASLALRRLVLLAGVFLSYVLVLTPVALIRRGMGRGRLDSWGRAGAGGWQELDEASDDYANYRRLL